MLSLEMMRTLFAYDAALWRRVWQSAEALNAEQLEQHLPYSHGSVRSQLFHVTEVSERWLRGLQGEPNAYYFKLDPAEVATTAALRARWERVVSATEAHVASLSEDDLAATLPGMKGPTWQVLVHLVNHGTDHRAQTLAALNVLGAPTFPQDLIFYLWFPQPQQ